MDDDRYGEKIIEAELARISADIQRLRAQEEILVAVKCKVDKPRPAPPPFPPKPMQE